MQKTVFITGNSSGLGYGLSKEYLSAGWQVYGLSRRGCQGLEGELHDIKCDLQENFSIVPALSKLLSKLKCLDLVYLNAGILGDINKITDITIEQIEQVMNVNVWANKIILDWLLNSDISVKQVVAISSGAALSTYTGWASYSLAKTSLNKLIEFYADEFKHTHFTSLAPGLVDTAMQAYICDEKSVPVAEFPSVQKMREAKKTNNMPSAQNTAQAIINVIPQLLELPSGSYADLRSL
jgi:NAD(P)-dependent dehydrogenase (short-subunit alcohol dehydrogenase family)